jgi:hypothetical protein
MGNSSTDLTAGSGALSLASLAAAPFTAGTSLALLPAALSVGSAGAGAASSIISNEGTASADKYKAEQLDQAAQYGNLKATQVSAQSSRNLSITLGNIDAVRAAAKTDPTSPTGAAVRDYTSQVGTEKKNIQVDSIMAQAGEDEANAAYMRKSASDALLSGDIGAGASVLKGLAGAASSVPGGNFAGANTIGGTGLPGIGGLY